MAGYYLKIFLIFQLFYHIDIRDVYRSLVASQELIYITGWSVWTELKLIRRREEVDNLLMIVLMVNNIDFDQR